MSLRGLCPTLKYIGLSYPEDLAMFLNLLHGLAANLRFSNGPWIIYQRIFHRCAREVTYIWQNRLRIVCDCATKDHLALREIFCWEVYAPWLPSGRFPSGQIRYVNVGSHIGAFDLWIREQGLVIENSLAAELNPETCRRGRRNLEANGLNGVCVVNCGVAAEAGFVDFVPSGNSLVDGIFPHGDGPAAGARTQRIELISLPAFLRQHAGNQDEFDLLKLDCEGAEYGILRVTPLAELRRFRHIIVEFHPEPAGESVRAAYQRLREAGFASRRGAPGSLIFLDLFSRDTPA